MSERNVLSWNSMITGYEENGRIDEAQQLLDQMPERNVHSWIVMTVGYYQNEKNK